jgi:hypothetical protein
VKGATVNIETVEPAQQRAARIVGFLYLLTMAISVLGFYARSHVFVRGDMLRTVQNAIEFEQLYRIGLLAELCTAALVMLLVVLLYVVLGPINRHLALAAVAWRLAENVILAAAPLGSFAALSLLTGPGASGAPAGQTSSAAFGLMRIHLSGFNLGFFFLGLGSAVFSYLWYQSRYIPRVIAGWGVFASSLLALATAALMVSPGLAPTLGLTYMAPMGLYEVGLGLWLLLVGIRVRDPIRRSN